MEINWEAQDWTKSDRQISKDTGQSLVVVRQWRRNVHKLRKKLRPKKPITPQMKTLERIAQIDFTKMHDCQIAAKFGITRERARQLRNIAGAKKLPKPKHNSTIEAEKLMRERMNEISGFSARKVKETLGLSVCIAIIGELMRKLDLPKGFRRKPDRFKEMNWKLPNKVLADIWLPGSNSRYVRVAQNRKVYAGHPALWDLRMRRPPGRVVEEEQEKAKAWFEQYYPNQAPQ